MRCCTPSCPTSRGADLIVTYNGKTFDVPVMETRWLFHRLQMPPRACRHFDMRHPSRRGAGDPGDLADSCCRLATLERTLLNVSRVGDVGGFEIPSRFFQFLRSGDPRPLEPVLEHNRLDLVSLAGVMARALELARDGHAACRDCAEARRSAAPTNAPRATIGYAIARASSAARRVLQARG